MEVVIDGMQRFVVDQQRIVDKLSNKQEFLFGVQGANPLCIFKLMLIAPLTKAWTCAAGAAN